MKRYLVTFITAGELDALITRVRAEYQMRYATLIGILEIKKHELLMETTEEDEKDQ